MVVTKLFLFGALFFSLKIGLNLVFTKVFRIKKEPYQIGFVNYKHKRMNRVVGLILIPIFVLLYYGWQKGMISASLFLGSILFLHAIPSVSEAYFSSKEEQHTRFYILCVGEAVFLTVVGIFVSLFDSFGLMFNS